MSRVRVIRRLNEPPTSTPPLVWNSYTVPELRVGEYTAPWAISASGGDPQSRQYRVISSTPALAYSMDPTGLFNPALLSTPGSYDLVVEASATGTASITQTITLTVLHRKLEVSPCVTKTAKVGEQYSLPIPFVRTGGQDPVTQDIQAGALPPWGTLVRTGDSWNLTGEVTGIGGQTYTALVRWQSADGQYARQNLRVVEEAVTLPATLTYGAPAILIQGASWSTLTPTTTNTTGTKTFSFQGLPGNMAGSSSTGALSVTGTYSGGSSGTVKTVTVTMTDQSIPVKTATATVSIFEQAVAPPAGVSITVGSVPNANAGSAYSHTVTAVNMTAPITWTRTPTTLPAPMVASAGPGAAEYTYSATSVQYQFEGQSYSHVLRAEDALGQVAFANIAFSVPLTAAPFRIVNSILPTLVNGSIYSQTAVTGAGGTAPYNFVHGFQLPTTVSFSLAGVLNSGGIPVNGVVGSYFGPIVGVDAVGRIAQGTLALDLANPSTPTVSLTLPSVTAATVGQLYQQRVTLVGAGSNCLFEIRSGNFPTDFSIYAYNTNIALLEGIPPPSTANQNFAFVIYARDLDTGASDQKAFTINVAPLPVSFEEPVQVQDPPPMFSFNGLTSKTTMVDLSSILDINDATDLTAQLVYSSASISGITPVANATQVGFSYNGVLNPATTYVEVDYELEYTYTDQTAVPTFTQKANEAYARLSQNVNFATNFNVATDVTSGVPSGYNLTVTGWEGVNYLTGNGSLRSGIGGQNYVLTSAGTQSMQPAPWHKKFSNGKQLKNTGDEVWLQVLFKPSSFWLKHYFPTSPTNLGQEILRFGNYDNGFAQLPGSPDAGPTLFNDKQNGFVVASVGLDAQNWGSGGARISPNYYGTSGLVDSDRLHSAVDNASGQSPLLNPGSGGSTTLKNAYLSRHGYVRNLITEGSAGSATTERSGVPSISVDTRNSSTGSVGLSSDEWNLLTIRLIVGSSPAGPTSTCQVWENRLGERPRLLISRNDVNFRIVNGINGVRLATDLSGVQTESGRPTAFAYYDWLLVSDRELRAPNVLYNGTTELDYEMPSKLTSSRAADWAERISLPEVTAYVDFNNFANTSALLAASVVGYNQTSTGYDGSQFMVELDDFGGIRGGKCLKISTFDAAGQQGGGWGANYNGGQRMNGFYHQFAVKMNEAAIYWVNKGDGGPTDKADSKKFCNVGRQNEAGQVALCNTTNIQGWPAVFINGSPGVQRVISAALTGYSVDYFYQTGINKGGPATVGDRNSFARKYGPSYRKGQQVDQAYHPASDGIDNHINKRGYVVPDPDAVSSGAVPFTPLTWLVFEIFTLNSYTDGSDVIKIWAAPYGEAPKLIFSVPLVSGEGTLTLSNLTNSSNTANQGYQAFEYLNYPTHRDPEVGYRPTQVQWYDESITSTSWIPFPNYLNDPEPT